MTVPDAASGRWVSFHLFAAEPFEPVLTGAVLPLAEAETSAGRVRRFFFIRYGEGGPHLRIRFLPPAGTLPGPAALRLEGELRGRLEALGVAEYRLERHPYSRAALYFGETRDSVYAELLNESTSWLALALLRAPGGGDRVRRWLALAAVLDVLLRATAPGGATAAMLAESREFARSAAGRLGYDVAAAPAPPDARVDASLLAALERMGPALEGEPRVRSLAALLLRARRYAPDGPAVATHALHLLCNKLGFSLREEHDIFTALQRLGPAPAGAPTAYSA